jgi:alginate O-acetyltransferase complex protein AlgI
MLFNSIPFAIFLIVVFLLFYFPFKGNRKWQNWLLLTASYFFYGYADARMVPLLLLSTTVVFFLAKLVHKSSNENKSQLLTNVGVLIGLGILFYYKYYNFFISSVNDFFEFINLSQIHWRGLDIVMPLGISFFTFKLISYIIEVSRGRIEPSNDFVAFATYTSFFPTIMSGPIDRPNSFIPQLQKYHYFDYHLAVDGCKQILWGAFQKIVIADNLATYTSFVWSNIDASNGSTLLIAAILFTFQLYTDFSGYSDMAIGIGKVFGYKVTKNFNYPFFAANVADYWRRWHMSLTSWLTDYVFMPLNIRFRNLGNVGMIMAIIINMFLVGIWHGANWTFAVFGIYHGLLFIPLVLSGSFMKRNKLKQTKYGFPVFSDFLRMFGTFLLVTIGLVIFNSNNVEDAFGFLKGIFSESFIQPPFYQGMRNVFIATFLTFILIVLEWKNQGCQYALEKLGLHWRRPFRLLLYFAIVIALSLFGGKEQVFIYFQF